MKISNQSGMTLIEIIVVMTIIALFATLATTQVMSRLDQAKVNACKTQVKIFEQALELYKADNDQFPTTDQGLQSLIEAPSSGNVPENYSPDGYLQKKQIPKDPWGKPYIYVSDDGQKFTIISYGKDKKEGGTGVAADISSDDL